MISIWKVASGCGSAGAGATKRGGSCTLRASSTFVRTALCVYAIHNDVHVPKCMPINRTRAPATRFRRCCTYCRIRRCTLKRKSSIA